LRTGSAGGGVSSSAGGGGGGLLVDEDGDELHAARAARMRTVRRGEELGTLAA
jgi:hypothetical protein